MEKPVHIQSKIIEEYWLDKLSRDATREMLPKGKSICDGKEAERSRLEISIPVHVAKKLQIMSTFSDKGRFILVLTAITGLLYRYSQGKEIHLGTSSTLQSEPRAANDGILILKSKVSGEKRWRELIEEMKVEVSRTFNHRDVSLDSMFEKIKSHHGIELEDYWQVACIDYALQTYVEELDRFHLIIELLTDPNESTGSMIRLSYRPEIYAHGIIRAFAANLLVCLDQLQGNLLSRLEDDEMDMMAQEERELLLHEFNRTAIKIPAKLTLHQLLEEQAERTPENIAVVDHKAKISYKELNEKANQLAHTLRSLDVGPESIVGVMVQPTIEVVIAIVAILKAGGAYCPIDPENPDDRVQLLLADSRIEVLLSAQPYLNRHRFKGTLVNISDPNLYIRDYVDASTAVYPSNLAYVIYTSGSTGAPKGVMVEHGSIVNQIEGLMGRYSFDEHHRHVLMAPLTFDPSIQQVFLPLATGGTVHLLTKEVRTNPSMFWRWVTDNRINVVNTVPSLMEILLEQSEGRNHAITYLILAGEVFTRDLAQRLVQKLNIDKLINIYGPTEASINTTLYEFNPIDQHVVMPIGKPLTNYETYILDHRRRLMPLGATGELYIAGAGLARGYLHNQELTDAAFVPNPFRSGFERMYKTGDLVKWLPDGNLEFIGRLDQQVKVRGMRVELSEVEYVLTENALIKEAVVIALEASEHSVQLAAFYTLNNAAGRLLQSLEPDALRSYLKQHLPEYMIPSQLVCLEAMPVTNNGKIDKKALPIDLIGSANSRNFVLPRNEIEQKLAQIWCVLLGIASVGVEDSFFEVGGDSLSIVRLQSRINHTFHADLTIAQLFTYHTIELQAKRLNLNAPMAEAAEATDAGISRLPATGAKNAGYSQEVAVIGIGCRFPLADGYEAFWDNLLQEVDAVRDVPVNRSKDSVYDVRQKADVEYPQGAYLERIDGFDAAFFGISPNEARMMDPQQRLFLQVVWEAVQDAGYSEKELYGSRTGVYVGAGQPRYIDLIAHVEPSALPGNLHSVIAGRISYVFNLTGPSEIIDTACSSSLMAVHHAVQDIVTGNCELAIAGGVNLHLSPVERSIFEMGIASPDGRTKAYDAAADGTGGGEGIGAVILKSLEQAVADGDHIYAVIKGTASNSDGRSNGITAPNAAAQANVIDEAWKRAGIDPVTIGYIEAHGTGTKLGDPIEIEGITQAFRRYTNRKQFCAISSVKSNIGHLDSAAGIAGFIKATLALYKRQIPVSIHFREPNRHIDFIDSPVYVNAGYHAWAPEYGIRRSGVSSFGLSGTNCHVVLEEYQAETRKSAIEGKQLFTLSARSLETLGKYADRFVAYLANTDNRLENICYCSNISRSGYSYRLAIVAESLEDLRRKLSDFVLSQRCPSDMNTMRLNKTNIYCRYPGQEVNGFYGTMELGDPIIGILERFIRGEDVDWGRYHQGQDRQRVSMPTYPYDERRYWIEKESNDDLSQETGGVSTEIQMDANHWLIYESTFGIGERLLDESGFTPVAGYKEAVSKFAALLILDVFQSVGTLTDPSEVYQKLFVKSMLGVVPQYERLLAFMLSVLETEGWIRTSEDTVILLKNRSGENLTTLLDRNCTQYPEFVGTFKVIHYCLSYYPDVLSGRRSPLSVLFPDGTPNFLASFANKGKTAGDLYEIMAIDSIKQKIVSHTGMPLKVLEVGAGSGTVGRAIFPAIEHLEIEYYYTDIGRAIILEAQKNFEPYPFVHYKVFNVEEDPFAQGFKQGEFDMIIALNVIHATHSMKNSLAQLKKVLAVNGTLHLIEKVQNEVAENLVWGMTEGWWLYEDGDRRTDSPLVSADVWEQLLREEYFGEVRTFPMSSKRRDEAETAMIVAHNTGKTRHSPDELLYGVQWVQKELKTRSNTLPEGAFLIFQDNMGIAEELIRHLLSVGQPVVTVAIGETFCSIDDGRFMIRPDENADYDRLLDEVEQRHRQIGVIVHLWTCTEALQPISVEECLQSGIYSLLLLTQALSRRVQNEIIEIRTVSNNGYRLFDESDPLPHNASIYGITKVIPQEIPMLQCYGLDLDTYNATPLQLAKSILDEIRENKTDALTAIRDGRFVQQMSRLDLSEGTSQSVVFRDGGVYMVVGGAGGLGLEVCRFLTRDNPVKLVIVNRTQLPERSTWRQWLTAHSHDSENANAFRLIKAFMDMEENGSEVLYYSGDVSDFDSMEQIVDHVRERLGRIDGVIHCAAATAETSKPLAVQTKEDFTKVLRPKIYGTLVLDRLFAEESLDFFILYSSVASLWGGAGGGDYAAANSFMDAFSAYRNRQGKHALAINWYAWEGLTGPGCMAYMSVQEALDAFRLGLSRRLDQVVIGKFDEEKLTEWAPMMKIQIASNVLEIPLLTRAQSGASSHLGQVSSVSRPVIEVRLIGKTKNSITQLEREIAQIWAETLGYEEINVHDNFFEIGGDSLLILRVLALLNERVDPEVEAGDLFSYGTVANLAEYIESKYMAREQKALEETEVQYAIEQEEEEELRQLIRRVKEEEISIDEAMKGIGEI
ncbi:amino acid adenylation domain-containing protein [Paenibacillus macquariensis]|uniref:Polyketide synthase PksN n=1 Tax=Paenibacillus macquariensis TaxID=948756 RepID=A0ABY1K2J5_9BACL|nr:amino acid adenylation domain-containing protein [Paenibacillus macquariensis]MEC0090197.1 amino acid adenylation domain-containing protein [Paenibacillus macquariensis]OAB39570.1 non-ribosomal peptide synthetase [Paenibacillus macquariensis subsp. macquariensis]SIR17193.1 polyketide synthase PksN [Paenibacillus macquariensis]